MLQDAAPHHCMYVNPLLTHSPRGNSDLQDKGYRDDRWLSPKSTNDLFVVDYDVVDDNDVVNDNVQ